MGWNKQAERDFWRRKCHDSFWWYFKVAFGADYNPEGNFLDEAVHRPLCDWFERHVKDWESKRNTPDAYKLNLAVIVPRRLGKTTIITQAGMSWVMLRNPELSIYLGSEKTEFAIDFLRPIRAILEDADAYARFGWLYGKWCQAGDGKLQGFTHDLRKNRTRKDPSFGTWGVESGITSKHPDVICLDDPTSYEKMASHLDWLQKVNSHIVSLSPVVEGDGMVVWVGTRYADGDHFGTFLAKEGIATIEGMSMPDLAATPDGKWHVYFLQARRADGTPIAPKTWNDKALKEYEKQDPNRYAAQVMNDPHTSALSPLTMADITNLIVAPDTIPLRSLWVTIHMDTAFKSPERQSVGDETVVQAWGHLHNGTGDVVFLEGYSSNVWTVDDVLKRLVVMVQDLRRRGARIRYITDEPEVGGKYGSWEKLIQNAFAEVNERCPGIMLLPRGAAKKISRIITAAGFWKAGHVRLLRNAPGLTPLMIQMSRIGSSAHDDWADAAADVFNKAIYAQMALFQEQPEDTENHFAWDELLKSRNPSPSRMYDMLHSHIEQALAGES